MAVRVLTAVARAGSALIALDNRQMLQSGDVLRIGGAPDEEYVTVAEIMGSRGAAPDAGSVRLSLPLREAYAPGTEVRLQRTPQVDAARQPVFLVVQAAAGTVRLNVAGDDGTAYLAGETVSVAPPSGEIAYHRLTDNDGLTAREVELDEALDYNHVIGEMVAEREQILSVRALDAGAWGNRLAVSVQDEIGGLATGTDVFEMNLPADPALPGTLRVDSLSGIEPGTLLELHHPDSGALGLPPLKVGSVNRSANNLVTLDSGTLTAAHANAFQNAVLAAVSLRALSREFRLAVYLKRKPDPAVPSRNDGLLDSEFFVHLSMDPRHSRYVERIVGTTWEAGDDLDDNGEPLRVSDRRSQGESAYIRVRDLAANAAEALSIRLGPETLTDLLPGAVVRAARHALADGDDGVSGMDDAMYIGQDSDEPLERTGLFSLRNIENISIIACPGQTTAVLQQALIDHCENMRYRFAVLDGPRPVNDTLADVLLQRQQFDSKYAALYHPWVMIPDPMPDNLSSIAQVPLPPSGHVLGVFARTDIERGVHKAPANEVMRGITGLSRSLNKPEHDILNPYPVNINVIRDFRPNNRGIRIWGARVITSDPDYKYVNVRRLLIFLEHSIERGLQWVTFEPNADPLWARVRRTISNFLTTAWRNGALEGTTPKEGFFVRCDRTTMTQDDIDNGRLICVIGVAPVKPAEYVIIRIGLWTANAEQE
ncbi:MAG: phage tail sheath family protein [Gammaproteobacteria bacterium]